MPAGFQASRDITYYKQVFCLADQACSLYDPDLNSSHETTVRVSTESDSTHTMDKRPTIVDVAKKAGVSKSTVSLVVRNSSSVRDKTRWLCCYAMEESDTVYNRSAANMRTGNAGLVGLVINDPQIRLNANIIYRHSVRQNDIN